MAVKIYHNPRCSKSQATLALLREHGVEPEIIDYLATPPSAEELRSLLALLRIGPRALARSQEKTFSLAGLGSASDDELIAAMVSTPILIERPIVVANGKAAIGRPPENVLDIL